MSVHVEALYAVDILIFINLEFVIGQLLLVILIKIEFMRLSDKEEEIVP